MASLLQLVTRRPNDCYYDDNGDSICPAEVNIAWSGWGRWVVVGVVCFVAVVAILGLLFGLLSCAARRRGARPIYGTGWMSRSAQLREAYNLEDGYGPKQDYAPPQGPPPNTY